MILGSDAIQRLYDFLLEEEATPVKDGAGIITAAGIDAHVRVDTIRACIRRIEGGDNGHEHQTTG
jgi:hypothetical protein